MKITIYTDGSCMRKSDGGGTYLICGYGIYFPDGEIPDVSRPLDDPLPTNNRAELTAIFEAIKLAIKFDVSNKLIKIYIYTDSQYCIKSLTEYV